jgi:rubrerythrin
MKNRIRFREWFEQYGESLFEGWLRAREDGNEELLAFWILGEWDNFVEGTWECPECGSLMEGTGVCEHCGEYVNPIERDYEVPYHGLLDSRSKAEEFLGLHHRIEEVQ